MTAEVRVLSADEVDRLVEWAGAEGWNPGLGDAEAFRTVDPEGFLGCFVGGEMASGIAAVAYDEAFGFIGLYICHPLHRGKGLGRTVWETGLARLGSRTIGLDGVPAQLEGYRAMGFAAAYETLRFTGPAGDVTAAGSPWSVEAFRPEHLEAALGLDRACFPADRTAFMRRWLQERRQSVVATRGGVFGGFGVVRRCLSGWKIGPLLAIAVAVARSAEGEVSIDVPEIHSAFARTLFASNTASSFRTSRMYLGRVPIAKLENLYGVTTLELG